MSQWDKLKSVKTLLDAVGKDSVCNYRKAICKAILEAKSTDMRAILVRHLIGDRTESLWMSLRWGNGSELPNELVSLITAYYWEIEGIPRIASESLFPSTAAS